MPTAKEKAEAIVAGSEFDWQDLGASLEDELGEIAATAAREMFAAVNRTDMFDVADQYGVDYGKARGAELVGMRVLEDGRIVRNPNPEWAITETTRNAIRDLVVRALEGGWSPAKLRDEIIHSEQFSNYRALMVSRTEASIAHNAGQHAAAEDSGMEFKQWLVGDEPCDICEPLDEEVRPIGEEFSSGDNAPPAHPNCRCSLVYMSKDEAEEEGSGDTETEEE